MYTMFHEFAAICMDKVMLVFTYWPDVTYVLLLLYFL